MLSDKSKGMAQLILVIIFIVTSFAISFLLQTTKTTPKSKVDNQRVLYVETKSVKGEPYRIEFTTTGTVQARANISITPQVSGRVTMMNERFFAGGSFKKDETLFEIDRRDYDLQLQQLQAQVAQAQTALDLAEADADASLKEWRQINGKKKTPPALVAREPQLQEAKAALAGAKAQLENAQLDLERATFSFPFDGRVIDSNLETGQYVAAGQSYGDVFDLSSLEVLTSLEDNQLTWLLAADAPEITITANFLGQTRTYEGMVNRATASIDEQTRFADFRFGFKTIPEDLLPGVFVNVLIRGMTMDDVGVLPASALQTDGSVWVMNDDNTLHKIDADILYSDENTIALNHFGDAKNVVTSRVSGATEGVKAAREGDTTSKDAQ